MPKTAADVDEDFVHDSADDGSTSDSSSEGDDSEAVTRREGRPPSRVYDDPANVAWRLQGRATRCGQDAKRLGVVFVDGAPLQAEGKEENEEEPDKALGRRAARSWTPTSMYDAKPAVCFTRVPKTVTTPAPATAAPATPAPATPAPATPAPATPAPATPASAKAKGAGRKAKGESSKPSKVARSLERANARAALQEQEQDWAEDLFVEFSWRQRRSIAVASYVRGRSCHHGTWHRQI